MSTRSENMRRLWSDPDWRARRAANIAAVNARQWSDPSHRAAAKERTRLQMEAARERRITDRVPRETSGGTDHG